ncbi:MAG: site-specific DNA-methyltransferase [Pyrinomonadaceae bacterium]|nr:site-specific DNA-methyltransferase [Pyrinomonadaceae bacterium]
MENVKIRAPRNRTLEITQSECDFYSNRLLHLSESATVENIKNRTICQNTFEALPLLPRESFDLMFVDPPYNLTKTFNTESFKQISSDDYESYLDSWLSLCVPLLKRTASVYICGDWRSSAAIQRVGEKHFKLRNRITWEREKGRGANSNWKNCAEDIWFFTVSDDYVFNADDVKLKRNVIAPYKENGAPKDWENSDAGKFRLTSASNLWTDISIPFWSMPENTEHPTQKPEKLLAKIILASTTENDLILDPFSGSGTTSVVAKKLKRDFVNIEIDERYCCLTEKRLDLAERDKSIQGYNDGVFWERNTFAQRRKQQKTVVNL